MQRPSDKMEPNNSEKLKESQHGKPVCGAGERQWFRLRQGWWLLWESSQSLGLGGGIQRQGGLEEAPGIHVMVSVMEGALRSPPAQRAAADLFSHLLLGEGKSKI